MIKRAYSLHLPQPTRKLVARGISAAAWALLVASFAGSAATAQSQAPRLAEEPQAGAMPPQPGETARGEGTAPPPSVHATPPGITVEPPSAGDNDDDGPGCPINRRPLELVV